MRSKCPFTFAHGMFSKLNIYSWGAILHDLHIVVYIPIEPSGNIETFTSRGKNKVIANFTQHLFGDLLILYFGPIVSNFVCDLLINLIFFLHHVVHISKYSLFELR